MGSGKVKTQPVEYPNNPALARNYDRDADIAQQTMIEARNRLRGIRSTYNRFASTEGQGATRLG